MIYLEVIEIIMVGEASFRSPCNMSDDLSSQALRTLTLLLPPVIDLLLFLGILCLLNQISWHRSNKKND
jgi:hypothetical protein